MTLVGIGGSGGSSPFISDALKQRMAAGSGQAGAPMPEPAKPMPSNANGAVGGAAALGKKPDDNMNRNNVGDINGGENQQPTGLTKVDGANGAGAPPPLPPGIGDAAPPPAPPEPAVAEKMAQVASSIEPSQPPPPPPAKLGTAESPPPAKGGPAQSPPPPPGIGDTAPPPPPPPAAPDPAVAEKMAQVAAFIG